MVLISYVFGIFFIMAFIADCLPLIKSMQKISLLGKASFKTIGSAEIADSGKQKLLLHNSAGIFKQSLKITALVVIVLVIGYLLVLAGGFLKIVSCAAFFNCLETAQGIIISIIAFLSYFLIKKIYARARL
jgi:hypothetical protein